MDRNQLIINLKRDIISCQGELRQLDTMYGEAYMEQYHPNMINRLRNHVNQCKAKLMLLEDTTWIIQ